MNENDALWQLVVDPNRVFILAEIGVNHNGDMELAKQLIDAALEARADGVKFQAYSGKAGKLPTAPFAQYQKRSGFKDSMTMTRTYELSAKQMADLQAYCESTGIPFLLSVFDEPSLNNVRPLDLPFYKVGSGELVNLPFLRLIASEGKPLVVSTGMAYLSEVDKAIRAIEGTGNRDIVLLHCVSNYPTSPEDANLRAMHTLRTAFGYPVGFSDHTLGAHVAVAAVALGACFIEKHFTLDKSLPGPDHAASNTPDEFRQLVQQIREVELALGTGRKEPRPSEEEMRVVARKGLVTTADIQVGELFDRTNLGIKKPGQGIPPEYFDLVLGRTAKVSLPRDTVVTWEAVLGPKGEES